MKKILFLLLGVMMVSGCGTSETMTTATSTIATTTATFAEGVSYERCSSPRAIADDWKESIYFYSSSFICFPTPQGKKMFEDNFKKIMVKESFKKYACQSLEQRQDFCVNDYKTTYTDCLARLEKKYIDCSARREVKIEQMTEEAKNLK